MPNDHGGSDLRDNYWCGLQLLDTKKDINYHTDQTLLAALKRRLPYANKRARDSNYCLTFADNLGLKLK
jgi:hypothetical protein